MKIRFIFSPIRLFLITFFLVALTVQVHAESLPTSLPLTVWDWITNNWAVIGLVISEALPFLPVKISGILEGVLAFMTAMTKKK